MSEMRHAYTILVRKLKRKRPLVIPRLSWEDNIKMGIKK
jgi:hypothetical protein